MSKKCIPSFLIILISIQSCVVYQNSSVSIDEAVDEGKAKLITTSDKEILINNIEKTDTAFYGNMGDYKIHIPTNEVQHIYLLDKKKSNKRALIAVGVGVGVLIGILFISFNSHGIL